MRAPSRISLRASVLCLFAASTILLAGCAGVVEKDRVPAAAAPEPSGSLALSLGGGVTMEFVRIEPGEFVMGSPESETARLPDETPHPVRISRPFHMSKCEVTQAQYDAVTGGNPSLVKAPDGPVENVTWDQAIEFCRLLSERDDVVRAGCSLRLPTEAEWEYACRAGTTTRYSFGDNDDDLVDHGWYDCRGPQPVRGKRPNPWGLYDMHGNVAEWCSDWYGAYPLSAMTDPPGAEAGTDRTMRGGSWYSIADYCRSAKRDFDVPGFHAPFLGFRAVYAPRTPVAAAP